jgi:hypothetical protein
LGAKVKGVNVTLTALANAEGIAKQTNPLQLLDWDNIETTGFIYSKHDVSLSVENYSKKINVNGVAYDFPYATAGTFTLGGYTFNIVTSSNPSGATRIGMEEAIHGLEPEATYYAYSFMTYKFQTSDAFAQLGGRLTFTTGKDCPITYPALVSNAELDICEGNEITLAFLQSLIKKESGFEYLIFTNEECTEELTADISTNYSTAPFHTFYVLAKEMVTGCTTYIEDALAFTIAVHPVPTIISTSDPELYVKEGAEFYLYVEASGDVEYQWYFNGALIEGATQFYYSALFNSSKSGTYSVSVRNECATFFVDFKIQEALDIIDIEKDYKLTVYPNPLVQDSKLYLSLELPEYELPEATAHILDITGKRVSEYLLTQPLTELTLNVANGIYLLKVNTSSGKELVTKIIVQ